MIPLEWSEPFVCGPSGPVHDQKYPIFSPCGKLIASIVDKTKIVVRNVETLSVVSYLTCLDPPRYIEWSPNGSYILACMPKHSKVTVFRVASSKGPGDETGDWYTTLREPLVGVAYATWSPWNSIVLILSDFRAKMGAWDLRGTDLTGIAAGRTVSPLPSPKVTSGLGVAASPNGKLLAILQRKDCKDSIVLYRIDSKDLREWSMIGMIDLNMMMDAVGLVWSPDSNSLALWETLYYGPRIVVISTDGKVLFEKAWESQSGLGVRSVKWSPSGSVLAIGTFDPEVLLINTVTWKSMDRALKHEGYITENVHGPLLAVFAEVEMREGLEDEEELRKAANAASCSLNGLMTKDSARGKMCETTSCTKDQCPVLTRYADASLPVKLAPPIPFTPDQLNPSIGVEHLCWSHTGRFIATVCLERPHIAWVWDVCGLKLDTILIHMHPIRDLTWKPDESDTLYLVCGNRNVYIWSSDGSATCVCMPEDNFRAISVDFSRCGRVLHASSKEAYSLGFMDSLAP